MTSTRPLAWRPTAPLPWTHPVRRFAAAGLQGTSAMLAQLAQRLAAPTASAFPPLPEVLEFYADAGAPEGALYLDGELVGYLPGVLRL